MGKFVLQKIIMVIDNDSKFKREIDRNIYNCVHTQVQFERFWGQAIKTIFKFLYKL